MLFCSDDKRSVCRNDKPLSNCKLAQQQSTFFFLLLLPSFSHRLSHTQIFPSAKLCSSMIFSVKAEVLSARNSLTAPTCVITPWPLPPFSSPCLAALPYPPLRLQIHFLHSAHTLTCAFLILYWYHMYLSFAKIVSTLSEPFWPFYQITNFLASPSSTNWLHWLYASDPCTLSRLFSRFFATLWEKTSCIFHW